MAKVSMIEREVKRKKLAKSYANRRAKLKAIVASTTATPEEKWAAQLKLAKLPRNSAKNRQQNRCHLTGRPHGYYRKFGICRNKLRELASKGEIPGAVKASW